MRLRGSILAVAVALAGLCASRGALAQGAFTLSSPDFKDGERMPLKNAGNRKGVANCVGENISPALNWANPPAGTKSFAILMFDPEARPPSGVIHWVAYGIPASATGLAEGETSGRATNLSPASAPTSSLTTPVPVPPSGPPHHYVFTLFATDLEPSALQPGLTREELVKALAAMPNVSPAWSARSRNRNACRRTVARACGPGGRSRWRAGDVRHSGRLEDATRNDEGAAPQFKSLISSGACAEKIVRLRWNKSGGRLPIRTRAENAARHIVAFSRRARCSIFRPARGRNHEKDVRQPDRNAAGAGADVTFCRSANTTGMNAK